MRKVILVLGLVLVVCAAALLVVACGSDDTGTPTASADATDTCVACHQDITPGVVQQWNESEHSKVGTSCFTCHEAQPDDPSGFEHNGFEITAVVTPNHCGKCHQTEVQEFKDSLHDEAGLFSSSAYGLVSAGTVDGTVTMGQTGNYKTHFSRESAEAGCLDCHGTVIEVGENGELINWPNVGIGRFNPDGSVGSCSACHTRHTFSLEQARKPETCGQCHLGPDHPQREIYEESKHGNLYESNGEGWNWTSAEWGPEDIEAPTCATCHMSGFGGATNVTHNVSARLKWELEPAFSWTTEPKYLTGQETYPIDPDIAARYEQIHELPEGSLRQVPTGAPNPFATAKSSAPDIYEKYVGPGKWWEQGENRLDALGGEALRSPDAKREDMLAVCTQCHSTSWAEGDLAKSDKVIDVYNAVALAIKHKYYDPIKQEGLDADIKFNGQSAVDTLWHEIWHHEGRIWRMGAFMQGQDWEHWEGAYEVVDDGTQMANWLDELRVRQAVKEAAAAAAAE